MMKMGVADAKYSRENVPTQPAAKQVPADKRSVRETSVNHRSRPGRDLKLQGW